MLKRLLLVFLILFVYSNVYSAEEKFIEKVGIDYRYYEDSMFKGSFVSKHAANSAEVVSLRAESKKLYEHYRLQFEIQCSDHKADEHPDLGQDTGFQEYSTLVMVKRHFAVLNDAYVGVFGGFGYISNFPKFENRDWADRDLESNIGHSHITGNIGMAIGKD